MTERTEAASAGKGRQSCMNSTALSEACPESVPLRGAIRSTLSQRIRRVVLSGFAAWFWGS